MVIHTYNVSTWKSEPGGSLVPGQPGLESETLSDTTTVTTKTKQNKTKT
jgi:hypothetical protein